MAEYDEIIGQEVDLLARIDEAKAEQMRLSGELAQLQAQIEDKRVELFVSQTDLQEAEATARRETAARKAAERAVVAGEERLRQQIVASYVSGGETSGTMEAILRSNNGEDAGNALAYSRAIVDDSDTLVRQLTEAEAERKRTDRAAKKARTAAEARRDDVAGAAAFLASARDRQVVLVADVEAQVRAESDALREVEDRKALIESQIAAMKEASDNLAKFLAGLQANQPALTPGALVITNPIPGYAIGSKFGQRRHPILGTTRLHAGGDLGAPSGTPIYAPADGVVVSAGDRGGYGNATVIDHGFSLTTLYAHQSRIDVVPGQSVKRGDPIGLVGSTGLSTGPHLHFETRIKGMPIDPEAVVNFTLPTTSYQEEREAAVALMEAVDAANNPDD
jgi:murein DD-endopeptidase MepM/ murein hydrolase activator NlpD